MENKNLKTSIFSLDTVFCESAEQPIDIDFTLPDYYSDISKILKCRATSRIASKSINGDRISVEGCATVTVIYCGNDNKVGSYEHQYPFSKSFDTGINLDGCMLNVRSKCEYVNCRAVTSRKIDVHGAVGIFVNITRRHQTDIVSDCEDSNVELLQGSVPATIPLGCAEKYLSIEEEIELGSGQPDIRCVIRYDADASITDSKIIAGKSIVKGELNVKLLYSPENEYSPQTVRYQLPFSQLIEIDGITEGCDCDSKVSIAQLEIKPRVSVTGECRTLMCAAKLLITSECCCNDDVAVVLDAYSRKFEASVHKNEICINKIYENVNQNFNCKREFEFSEGTLCSVLDMWCEVGSTHVKFEENSMHVYGNVIAYIIANDSDEIPLFYEKEIEFKFCHPMNTDGEFKTLPQITIMGANFMLSGDNTIEIRVELNVLATIYKCSTVPLITNINIDDTKPRATDNKGAMTIYFAAAGEKVWDIAKKHFANVEEIKQMNELTEDVIICDKMILISNN